jgi:hypothetical protein
MNPMAGWRLLGMLGVALAVASAWPATVSADPGPDDSSSCSSDANSTCDPSDPCSDPSACPPPDDSPPADNSTSPPNDGGGGDPVTTVEDAIGGVVDPNSVTGSAGWTGSCTPVGWTGGGLDPTSTNPLLGVLFIDSNCIKQLARSDVIHHVSGNVVDTVKDVVNRIGL